MTKDKALKLALEALEDLLDQTEPPPDTNCSCHICPPCNDCVDYSGVRYAIEQANKAITAIKEALAQPEERNFCPRCGKRTADLTTIHTCTPPQIDPNQWAFDNGLEST